MVPSFSLAALSKLTLLFPPPSDFFLQYLTARSSLERERLLPVVGTVLSFTPEEHAEAQTGVQSGAGLKGIGGALVDGISRAKEGEGGFVGGLGRLMGRGGTGG